MLDNWMAIDGYWDDDMDDNCNYQAIVVDTETGYGYAVGNYETEQDAWDYALEDAVDELGIDIKQLEIDRVEEIF